MEAGLEGAREFLALAGRLLERRLLATLFEGAPREGALRALRAFQNPDGGFAYGLEPDKRTAASQPVDLQIALEVLDLLDAFDVEWLPEVLAVLPMLSTPEGALPFATPAVADAPRAEWWNVPTPPPPSINPTGTVVGLLLKHGIRDPWVERATEWCWQAVEQLEGAWFHDLMNAVVFLRYAPDQERAKPLLERLGARILTENQVTFDPEATGYVKGPLDWAPEPEHPFAALFTPAQFQSALEALQRRQQSDGGWPINWEPISPQVGLEARSWATLHALLTLRAYGAVDSERAVA